MYDRFERSSVLPGKAVAALLRLAGRSGQKSIIRHDAITEFQSRSGLKASIIDSRVKISRETVTKQIREQVVGQDEPVKQLVDRVMVAAARMNDTSRPIGTYLLVGPTGVGKTQLAKAVASCLFDEGGMIRLDMNELSSPMSASRLVGTFDAPDGLLTSAVRRRPNAVLLLDEIEKAHPSVLDVLLQALGEARLSDARGRTVDLSGLLILMTSNLGARTSGRSRGFTEAGDAATIQENHLRAVKEFFRPEFFNRIDGVLSFERLSAEVMETIAMMQFQEILQRDGLQRRSVLIDIDPQAIRQTAARGYNPAMGARALKRQIERDLIRPAAKVLAATKTDQPTLLRLHADGDSVQTQWQPIQYVQQAPSACDWPIEELCDRSDEWLDSIEPTLQGGPLSFEVNGQGVDVGALELMTLRDSVLECQQTIRQLREVYFEPRLQRPQSSPIAVPSIGYRFDPPNRTELRDLQAMDDIQDYLRDSLVISQPGEIDTLRDCLINQLGRLHAQLAARGTSARWLVWTRWYGDRFKSSEEREASFNFQDYSDAVMLAMAVSQWSRDDESLMIADTEITSDRVAEFSGALAAASIQHFCGSWLFVNAQGQIKLAEVKMRAIANDRSIPEQFAMWKAESIREPAAPVRRIIPSDRPMVDLMTGAAVSEQTGNKYSGVKAIVQLLQQSRRSLEFLRDRDEVST
ncbi:MAG: ATP-dependent Clp protease ATP-binding subunit [Pirellulaceae bacterium]|nr:ATP-dependent Clp protease ATP-binding subunit [Pirellulaceae bacterium]